MSAPVAYRPIRVPVASPTIATAVSATIDRLKVRSLRSSAVMNPSRPCRATGARDHPSHFQRIGIAHPHPYRPAIRRLEDAILTHGHQRLHRSLPNRTNAPIVEIGQGAGPAPSHQVGSNTDHASCCANRSLARDRCLARVQAPSCSPPTDFAFYHENVMGTSLELRVKADDQDAARRAEACVLGEIDRLSAILSGYDASTEFSRWQATSGLPVRVSPELFEVLQAATCGWRKVEGPLTPGWKHSRSSGRAAPSSTAGRATTELAAARAS